MFPKRVAYRTRPGPYISGSVTPSCSCTRETQLLQRPFWTENDDGWAAGGAVAAEVGRQLGGEWTARSVRTLAGTLRCGIRSRIRRVNVLLPDVPRLSVVERALESRVEVA